MLLILQALHYDEEEEEQEEGDLVTILTILTHPLIYARYIPYNLLHTLPLTTLTLLPPTTHHPLTYSYHYRLTLTHTNHPNPLTLGYSSGSATDDDIDDTDNLWGEENATTTGGR